MGTKYWQDTYLRNNSISKIYKELLQLDKTDNPIINEKKEKTTNKKIYMCVYVCLYIMYVKSAFTCVYVCNLLDINC